MRSPRLSASGKHKTFINSPQSPSRIRPVSPTTIHYPTDAKSPTSAAVVIRSRKNSMLLLLGVLTFLSLATNIFVWYGNPWNSQYEAGHYGLEGGRPHRIRKTDPEWTPAKRRRDGEARWIFGEGRMGRPARRRDDTNGPDRGRGAESAASTLKYHPSNRNATSPGRRGERRDQDEQENENRGNRPEKRGGRRGDAPHRQPLVDVGKGRARDNFSGKPGSRAQRHKSRQKQQLSFRAHPSRKESRSPPWSWTLPAPTEPIKLNRLVLLDGRNHEVSPTSESAELEDWLAKSQITGEDEEEDLAWKSQTVVWDGGQECVPMAEWQTTFHPTCNSIHEMDISLLINQSAFSLVSSKGHWRNAWKVDLAIAEANGSVNTNSSSSLRPAKSAKGHNITAATMNKYAVLKSLKYVHEPNEEIFELSRVDAVSLDVLTASFFTININGFCGTSSIQEFAGGDLKGLLPKLDPIDKLRYAAWMAEGVADVHSIGESTGGNNHNHNGETGQRTATANSMIHNDLNMDNVLLGNREGVAMPIINDFNIAVFRKKDAKTGAPCKFRGRFANPQWMSPEQQEREDELSTGYLNEKIDVYALGNILYKVVAGNSPWKYDYNTTRITPDVKAKIARAKLRGAKPKVPPGIRNSTDPSIMAVLTAMNRCYRNDAALRPSAKDVADYLKSKLDAVEAQMSTTTN